MKTYPQAMKAANKLVNDLTTKAKANPKKFGENFGEKEVRKFEDKIRGSNTLTYSEQCNVLKILDAVMDITPY